MAQNTEDNNKQIETLSKAASFNVEFIHAIRNTPQINELAAQAQLTKDEADLLQNPKEVRAIFEKYQKKGLDGLSHGDQEKIEMAWSIQSKFKGVINDIQSQAAWNSPTTQQLTSAQEIDRTLLSSGMPEAYRNWASANAQKWLDEGKQVHVASNRNGIIVTDGSGQPDQEAYQEYQKILRSQDALRTIDNVEEARRILTADIAMKNLSSGMSIPQGMSTDDWRNVRSGNGLELNEMLKNLDSMYADGVRLSVDSKGNVSADNYNEWKNQSQLKTSTAAQNWIAAKEAASEDADKKAWKPLADIPGLVGRYYDSPGAIPLTVDADGKLDVTNIVNWSRNQGGFEKYHTNKASIDDKHTLNIALEGLHERGLVVDRALPEPIRTADAAVTNGTDSNHFTAVYNNVTYNVTLTDGVATATPEKAPAAAAPASLAAGTPPATGTELPLDMTPNGTSFTAEGGMVNTSGQPIKLTLTGTTDGKTAIITGVTGVNTVTGVAATLDAAEVARIINHGDSAKTASTFEVKDGKLAFKTPDPHTSLEQLGADILVAAQKQVADVNSLLEVKKGEGNAISIPTTPVEMHGKHYNLTFNGTSADGKTATITSATLTDDAGKTTTIEGDKLNAIFNQKSGTAITYNIDASSHVAINSSLLPAATATIVNQSSGNAAAASAAPTVVNPATARPEEEKENFLEKNKFGIGAGILGLLAGMILGGGGFMGLLIGLIVGAVALFAGGMADPHGFSHSPAGPAAARRPDAGNATEPPTAAPQVQGQPAPEKKNEQKQADVPPSPSATVTQNGTQLVIDYKEQFKGNDGKMQDAKLHLVGDIKDGQFTATSASVTGVDTKNPGREVAVDPKELQAAPINLQPIALKVDDKGAVDIKDAQQKALDSLNGKINAYRVEFLKENPEPAKRPDNAPPAPAAATPAPEKSNTDLFKQLFNNDPLLSPLSALGVKSADDPMKGVFSGLQQNADLSGINSLMVNKVVSYGGDVNEATSGLNAAANKQNDPNKKPKGPAAGQ